MLTLLAACAAGGESVLAGPAGQEPLAQTKPTPQPGPTAALDFGRLLLERPPVPLTIARDAKPQAKARKLPRDGSIIEDRKCRIVYHPETGWYLLKFMDAIEGGDNFSRWVLQSETLAAIKPRIDSGDGEFRVIKGETTVYRKRLFILLREVSSLKPPAQAAQPVPSAQSAPPTKKPGQTGPSEAAATMPGNSGGSPDDILAEMARRRPSKPVAQPEPRTESLRIADSVSPARGAQLSARRGEMVVNRLVTIVPSQDGEWMEARFVSDNTLREQPIRLLPCMALEIAERLDAAKSRRVVKFRISGWTTMYEGRRYMLLRKAMKVPRISRF